MTQRSSAPRDGGGIVYTTGIGERCPNCLRPIAQCVCKKGTPGKTTTDGVVRVGRETAGRKGKGVTVITGLGLPEAELQALATELKKKCGSGGAVAAGTSSRRAITSHSEGMPAKGRATNGAAAPPGAPWQAL